MVSLTVARAIRSFWSPPERVFQHLHFKGEFPVKVGASSFIVQTNGEPLENDLFWRGWANGWEGETLKIWERLCKSSRSILDIGANSGIYSLAAKAINPKARVAAVEPSIAVLNRLKANIALNDFAIEVIEAAATDHDGEVTFHDFGGQFQYSASIERHREGTTDVTVAAITIDTLCEKLAFKPDLLKLDIERHEPAALRGASKTIATYRPTIICEILDDEREYGVREAMDGLGYKFTRICPFNVLLES